jgi:hypothetical protein
MTLIQRCQGGGSGRWSCRRTFGVAERAAAEGTRTEWNARFGSNRCVTFSQRPLSRASRAFTGQILKCTRGRFDPFATRPAMTAICAFRPKTPRRFVGHLVADPIGHQVRFSPLGVPESLKSSEHRFLLVVGHLIKHAHVGLDRLHRLAPILRRAWHG